MRRTVLLVEDEQPLRELLARELERHDYRVLQAQSVSEARVVLARDDPELLLLDLNLPGESGFALLRELTGARRPGTVMLTAHGTLAVAETALELGAYDFVAKPFRIEDVLIALSNAARRRRREVDQLAAEARLANGMSRYSDALTTTLTRLERAQADVVERLTRALELRDEETGAHIDRVSRGAALTAVHMGLPGEGVELIRLAAPLHDVGKIAVPDAILRKPATLTADEWVVIRRHPELGRRLLGDSGSDVLDMAALIAWTHHERWDGKGYPRALCGEAIPLPGRLTAVADVFDALTHPRPYRGALSHEEALGVVRRGRGEHFDPDCADAFLAIVDQLV